MNATDKRALFLVLKMWAVLIVLAVALGIIFGCSRPDDPTQPLQTRRDYAGEKQKNNKPPVLVHGPRRGSNEPVLILDAPDWVPPDSIRLANQQAISDLLGEETRED